MSTSNRTGFQKQIPHILRKSKCQADQGSKYDKTKPYT